MSPWLYVLLFVVLGPVAGGILAGLDRKISARMQARLGPPVLQPFYDVIKLWHKENTVVRRSQNLYILYYLILMVFTGGLFFYGGDMLLVIFAFTLAAIFFVIGAFKASSPYSFIGAQREMIQMMAYEPLVLLVAVGMYLATGSFSVADILNHNHSILVTLPGIFICLLFALEIKFRKSPFDLSSSHHAHQELVRGITTEFAGPTLALIEIAHWYENVLLLGWVYLFFAHFGVAIALVLTFLVYLFVILTDNTFARLKWQMAVKSAWGMALIFGFGNVIVLAYLIKH